MSSPPLRAPAPVRWLSLAIVVLVLLVRLWPHAAGTPRPVAHAPAPVAAAPEAPAPVAGARAFGAGVGFRSQERLAEHFHKHGAEFGARSAEDYLRTAQALRDRAAGGDVLELTRADGVTCRFDRATGTFLAFGADGVIRTCFRPHDGERYFERQASRAHDGP